MKIQVSGSELNAILKAIKPFINLKNFRYMPIMHTVKITAADSIYFEATDLDKAIKAALEGDVLEPGEACVDFKELQQAVKGQKGLITLTNTEVLVGNMPISVNPFPAEDFPTIPAVASDFKEYTLTNDFIKGLKTCLPYASEVDSRPVFASVWIEKERLLASDTHALISCRQSCINHDKDVAIDASSVKAIVETFKKSDGLKCRISDDHIEITDRDFTVVSRAHTDWIKPAFDSIIKYVPKTVNSFTVNTKEFQSVVKSLVAEKTDKVHIPAWMDFSSDGVTMQTDKVRAFALRCEPKIEKELTIAYDNEFLKRAVNSFSDEEITLEFAERVNPIVIRNDQIFTLFLPVRQPQSVEAV